MRFVVIIYTCVDYKTQTKINYPIFIIKIYLIDPLKFGMNIALLSFDIRHQTFREGLWVKGYFQPSQFFFFSFL